ncbi:MAG TPA: M3 family metallopeptidase [Candidatus Limnocylindrales bacterium]|nr:M3 family metallopeptidase [Candidatus Limnocylindrales bacterium]
MATVTRGVDEQRRYDYASMTADTVNRAADDAIAEADRLVAGVVAVTGERTYENTLRPLGDAADVTWSADGIGTAIGYIHPDPAVREAAGSMEERTDRWRNGLARRDDLAAAIQAYASTDDARSLSGARRRILDLWLLDISHGGHDLDPDAKAEFSRLLDRAAEVAVTFGRNVGESSDELVLGPDDLEGLSGSLLSQLPDGPEPGSRILTITYSTVFPFVEQSPRRDLRELAIRKYYSRAAEENATVIADLVETRRRAARIAGRDSWSQFANEARMSGGRAEVMAFLERVTPPLQALAAKEQATALDQLLADGGDGPLQMWDWPFYNTRQRRALGLDFSALTEYFPLDAVFEGLFSILEETFGVAVTRIADVPVWHSDVIVLSLDDAGSGEHLADLYLDLFVREGKRPGGWMAPLTYPRNDPGEARRPPVLSLVLNFAGSTGEGPALIPLDDVAGLFHEFGHVLEFGLKRSEGTPIREGWIEFDFVEAPSQIMENWAWSPAVLRRFARHHVTGAPPPDALLENLPEVRQLNVGTETLWFFVFRSLVDQYLHGPDPMDVIEAYRRGFAVTGFPFMEGTNQPASFTHLQASYDAGFYSYIWSRVFGDDMFSAFEGENLLSPDVGRRYRREVLEPSWAVPGRQRVENFLGRPPSDRAFLKRLGIAPD